MATATGSFEVASWNESTYKELDDGGKLTLAEVGQTFDGDIEGEGSARWLMAYRSDGTASFVGLQHVDGRIGDRRGYFVLETSGEFDGQMAKWQAKVVPGSARGDLEGLTGEGQFGAPHGSKATFEVDYRLA